MSNELFECPCCKNQVFAEQGGYEICPICHWEDDPVQSNEPDYAGGANQMSLNHAREVWIKTQSIPKK
ncbi:MAG: hypothetical protein LBI92_02945 [Azoarcus sp.]|jgi:uncharacterized Zn finger protein (UPF0148 family)|nr:hypothetical protein [Azoarcus sp.]